MSESLRGGCAVGLLTAVLLLIAGLWMARADPHPQSLNRVAAWMPTSWDAQRARASWTAHREQIDELSPVWYQLNGSADGSIVEYAGACDATIMAEAGDSDTLVLPLIHNYYPGLGFDPRPVSTVIHDPTLRARHIGVLVSETLRCGYDGIDIDYESLNGQEDRVEFSLFIEELAEALHDQGKLLSVTVHPKTSEPGGWDGPKAQDWERIGAAADRLRVMTYGYHWSTSDAGPIAPLFWMEQVIAFAVSVVSPTKVYVGVHFYGLDWDDGPAESLVWEDVQTLMGEVGAQRRWAARDDDGRTIAEPWFTYTADSTEHQVWYADWASVAARVRLVERYGLGGVAVWRLGGEDPKNWGVIAAVLRPAARLFLPIGMRNSQ